MALLHEFRASKLRIRQGLKHQTYQKYREILLPTITNRSEITFDEETIDLGRSTSGTFLSFGVTKVSVKVNGPLDQKVGFIKFICHHPSAFSK